MQKMMRIGRFPYPAGIEKIDKKYISKPILVYYIKQNAFY